MPWGTVCTHEDSGTRDSTLNAMGSENVMKDVLPVTTRNTQVTKEIRTRTSKLPRLRRRLPQRSSENLAMRGIVPVKLF